MTMRKRPESMESPGFSIIEKKINEKYVYFDFITGTVLVIFSFF